MSKVTVPGGLPLLVIAMSIAMVVSGCASWIPSRASFGVRPDVPMGRASDKVRDRCHERHPARDLDAQRACIAFYTTFEYSAQLEQSYLSRATQNRWWIYVAGTLALGTVAASGGLAAAGAASLGTIALLNISGGAAAGFFGVLDNSRLADIYTIAATDLAKARSCAQEQVAEALALSKGVANLAGPASHASVAATYYSEEGALAVVIADAMALLETERTNSAIAAVLRAKQETERLQAGVSKITEDLKKQQAEAEAKTKKDAADVVAKTKKDAADEVAKAKKDAATKEAEAKTKAVELEATSTNESVAVTSQKKQAITADAADAHARAEGEATGTKKAADVEAKGKKDDADAEAKNKSTAAGSCPERRKGPG